MVPSGGPQGVYLGHLEYKGQSNANANMLEPDSRFKLVDDLNALEKINLLGVGMASHNSRNQVTKDINISNKLSPPTT